MNHQKKLERKIMLKKTLIISLFLMYLTSGPVLASGKHEHESSPLKVDTNY